MKEKLEKRNANENIVDDEIYEKNVELYSLCRDQILKCACLMADIFKREIENSCILEVCVLSFNIYYGALFLMIYMFYYFRIAEIGF